MLETVPGVVITQHSGEGKANQYYLRGFNLDHGTDFATTVAGMPVNMPTHGHGQGYSDLNFLIPELVSGVQYSKGPYFADQGDFATAGSANINYASALDKPIVRVGGGGEGFGARAGRGVAGGRARAPARRRSRWSTTTARGSKPDDYRKLNGVAALQPAAMRVNGLSVTGMGYRGDVELHRPGAAARDRRGPDRPIRRASIRPTAATPTATADRSNGSARASNASTKVIAYGIGYDLNLFSNFTYFLDDPVHGDQFHQADHRFVTGGKVSHRRLGAGRGREVQNTFGVQVRNDDITNVGLYHTEARQLLDTDPPGRGAGDERAPCYAQNEIAWTPWLRTLAGLRVDGYRFHVDAERSREQRHAPRRHRQPEGRRRHRPVQRHRVLRQRRPRLSQQRRARDDHHARSVDRRGRRSGDAAGARQGRRGRRPHGRRAASADEPDAVDAVARLRTGVLGRRRHDRSRAGRAIAYGVEFANYYTPAAVADPRRRHRRGRARISPTSIRSAIVIPGSVATVVSAGATIDSCAQRLRQRCDCATSVRGR